MARKKAKSIRRTTGKGGNYRKTKSGAGMTKKGVAAYKRRNPGSKLQTAVTTPPSKLKAGSKAANRRKAFCSRSKSWTGEFHDSYSSTLWSLDPSRTA